MKKVAFILVGLLAIMFAGCGEGSSTSSLTTVDTSNDVVSEVVLDNGDVTETTVTNELGIDPSLGLPPALPES